MRKRKKDHYPNLDENDVADYEQFWRTVKPLLSDKVKSSLVEGEKIINEDGKNAEIFNNFFKFSKNLKISEYLEGNLLASNISHPIFKTILNFRNHPIVSAIKNLIKVSISVE